MKAYDLLKAVRRRDRRERGGSIFGGQWWHQAHQIDEHIAIDIDNRGRIAKLSHSVGISAGEIAASQLEFDRAGVRRLRAASGACGGKKKRVCPHLTIILLCGDWRETKADIVDGNLW